MDGAGLDGRAAIAAAAASGQEESKLAEELQQYEEYAEAQRQEDAANKRSFEETRSSGQAESISQQQEEFIVSDRTNACDFYRHQNKLLQSLYFADNPQLPVWPHDSALTDEVKRLWTEVKSLNQEIARLDTALETPETTVENPETTVTTAELVAQFNEKERAFYDSQTDEGVKEMLLAGARNKRRADMFRQRAAMFRQSKEMFRQRADKFRQRAGMAGQRAGRQRGMGLLQNKGFAIEKAAQTVREQIAGLAAISQPKVFPGTEIMRAKRKKLEQIEPHIKAMLNEDEVKVLPNGAGAGNKTADVFTGAQDFEKGSYFSREKICAVVVPEEIKQIAETYNEFMQGAKFLRSYRSSTPPEKPPEKKDVRPVSKDDYQRKIESTLKALDKALFAKFNNRQHKTRKGICFPGARSQETEGTQPIFGWILDNMATVLSKSDHKKEAKNLPTHRHSFYKPSRSRETPLVDVAEGQHIRGNYTVTRRGCSLVVYPPDALPFIIELKPLYRAGEDWEKVYTGGERQTVCHMAKFIAMCFNFAGAGLDGHATGAVGSLAYLRVMQLELHETGTTNASLRLRKSQYFPLFTKANFDKWKESNDTGINVDSLSAMLYPDGREGDIPTGFKLLYHIMTAGSDKLFSQLCGTMRLLGLGNFSWVFGVEGTQRVLNISRIGRFRSLANEVAVLRHLGQGVPSARVPTLVQHGRWKIAVGSMITRLPYLEIAPRACSLASKGYYNLQ